MITQIAFRDFLSGREDSGGTTFDEVALSDLGDGQVRGGSGERMREARSRIKPNTVVPPLETCNGRGSRSS